jgi:hypothetical protein
MGLYSSLKRRLLLFLKSLPRSWKRGREGTRGQKDTSTRLGKRNFWTNLDRAKHRDGLQNLFLGRCARCHAGGGGDACPRVSGLIAAAAMQQACRFAFAVVHEDDRCPKKRRLQSMYVKKWVDFNRRHEREGEGGVSGRRDSFKGGWDEQQGGATFKGSGKTYTLRDSF